MTFEYNLKYHNRLGYAVLLKEAKGELIKIDKITLESVKQLDNIKQDIILVTEKVDPTIAFIKKYKNVKGILCKNSIGITSYSKIIVKELLGIALTSALTDIEYNELDNYKTASINDNRFILLTKK